MNAGDEAEHLESFHQALGEHSTSLPAFVHAEFECSLASQRADERELWRLHGRKGTDELRVDFIALGAGSAPRKPAASVVLEGLTPEDVCDAAAKVRFGQNLAKRTEAVSRIVLRRQRAIVGVREEEERCSANPDRVECASATDA